MRDKFDFTEIEPDFLAVFMAEILKLAPDTNRAILEHAKKATMEKVGGTRAYLPKGAKRLTPEQRQAVFQDGLTNMPTEEITTKHKISRATLYREMKKGGGRFS